MTVVLVLVVLVIVFAAIAVLGRATRRQRRELELERRRLEAFDERRAAARLYPEPRVIDVAPQRRPARRVAVIVPRPK